MFRKSGIISDKLFRKYLGKKIFIYPLNERRIKGSSYNLTASKIAFYKKNGKNISVVKADNTIEIGQGRTVLIQTEESIYVTKDICGTYHSKVKDVSRGLSSISTTLDPGYFGTSLIAVTNNGDEKVTLKVGDSFCTLILYKMARSSSGNHDNVQGRTDLSPPKIDKLEDFESYLSEYKLDKGVNELTEENEVIIKSRKINEINDWFKEEYRLNKEVLIKEVKKKIYKEREVKYKRKISMWMIVLFVIAIVINYLKYNGGFEVWIMPLVTIFIVTMPFLVSYLLELYREIIIGE